MERTVEEYKKHSLQDELGKFHTSILHPAYAKRFNELLDFESARYNPSENGFKGTLEYPVLYPGDDEYEWHEINVFIDTEEDGTRVANILGRDITEAHNVQEKNERELRAAATKNQILSELTKMLYSYNLTLNLRTGKYSMIMGAGMTQFMEIFRSTDDYEKAYNKNNLTVNLATWKYSLITGTGMNEVLETMQQGDDYVLLYAKLFRNIAQEDQEKLENLIGIHALLEKMNRTGFVGTISCRMISGKENQWHEVNLFIGTNEDGTTVANILGRDVTEAHDKADTKAQLEIANTFEEDKRNAFKSGMNGHIAKPIKVDELLKSLANILG